MAAADSTAFRALSDVVLAIASEHEVEPVLQRLVHSARELAGARYAALGIPDGEGAFASFITSGMSDELIESMGPLPRTHGMLGAMLDSTSRTGPTTSRRSALPRLVAARAPADALVPRRADRRPRRGDRLAVPDREGGRLDVLRRRPEADRAARGARRDRDRERAAARAQPRAVASSRSATGSRASCTTRVTQRLFGVALAAESASTLLARDRDGAAAELKRVSELARGAMEELRAVVFELRPGSLEAEGLATVLRKHIDVLRRVSGQSIDLRVARGAATRARPGGAGAADRAGGARQRAPPRGGRAHLRAAGGRRRPARAERGRRRLRLRSRGPRGARPAARADVDAGARDRARRDAHRVIDARRRHHVRLEVPA